MGEQLDYTTLTWVKDEIQESLNQTHQALEAYVEDPSDTTQIRFCATYLHQVYGTLQMVEIYGAALLAEEMEKLANALLNDQVAQKDDAYDVLMRAIIQLPSYLESLEHGQMDMPVVLTPLLNDLRAARGESLLSENAFFSPDLSIAPPEKKLAPGKTYPDIQTYARKVRPIYQVSLLGLLRDKDISGSLKKLAAVLRELQNACQTEAAQRLWWIAGGIIEALIEGGLERSSAIKLLLGQIDREIKGLIDNGENAISEQPPTDLLKNCLYYTGSATSAGPRVSALKQAFNLEQLLPYSGAIEQALADLKGSTADIMDNVSSVIQEDLLQVKDQLDIFVRNSEREISQLAPLGETLGKTADTLAMLGLGDLRKVIQDQAKHIAELVATETDPADDILMEMASALLYVEASLQNLESSRQKHGDEIAPDLAVHEDEEVSEVLLPSSEQAQITKLVIKESKEELADVKEGFNTFAVEPDHFDVIAEAPAKLARIQGALAVMNLDRAAKLLGAANAFIREDVLSANNAPDAAKLDTLADAITSIEYYLEAIEEGRGKPEGVLAVAEISVEQLGHPIESVSAIINVATDTAIEEAGSSAKAVDEYELDTATETAALSTEDDLAFFDEQLTDAEAETQDNDLTADLDTDLSEAVSESEQTQEIVLPQSFEPADTELAAALTLEPATTPGEQDTATAASHVAAEEEEYLEENIDDEILEIFVEEADEVLGTMTDCLHAWRANNDDQKSLETLRRSYHTIKGSGRLAGAMVMGEFAWAIENMLNRVLDNKISPNPGMFTLLEQAEAVVRGLLAHLRKETDQRPPVRALLEQADAMAEGREFSVSEITVLQPAAPADNETAAEESIADTAAEEIADALSADITLDSLGIAESEDELILQSPNLDFDHEQALTDGLDETPTETLESQPFDELTAIDNDFGEAALEDSIAEDLSLEDDLEVSAGAETAAYEPTLVEVFRKETASHLATIHDFLSSGAETIPVDDDLHRALHTLHGSARMANVSAISELSEPMDRLIRAMHERELSLDAQGQALLTQLADTIATIAADFDKADFIAPDNSELITRIGTMLAQVQAIALPSSEEPSQPASADEEDAELISIFVDEAEEIIASIDKLLQQWQGADDNDLSVVGELQRSLHTLKGGARLANLSAIGDLTHELETVLEAVAEGRRAAAHELPELVQQGMDWLGRALEDVRAGIAIDPASELLHQIQALTSAAVDAGSNDTTLEVAEPVADSEEAMAVADTELHTDTVEATEADATTEELPDEYEEIEDSISFDAPRPQVEPVTAVSEVDYDPDLLEVFLEEAEEIQENTERALHSWSGQHENLEQVAELQRLLHTLKGGARMANVPAIGDLAHAMESLLERISDGRTKPEPGHTKLIQACHDWLTLALEEARNLQPTFVPADLLAQLEAAIRGDDYSTVVTEAPVADSDLDAVATPLAEPIDEDATLAPEAAALSEEETEEIAEVVAFDAEAVAPVQKSAAASDEQVRVRAELLNNLVNFSGEINIYNSRIAQQLGAYRFNLAELDQTVHRLREQLRKFEIETETQIMYRHETTSQDAEDFDPLELDRFSTMQQLSRGMVESLGDLTSIQFMLDNLSSETDVLLLQQQRVTSELQEGLMRTRMVAFSSVLPRLRRILRQTCNEIGKQAELMVTGAEGELDRTQLNRIVPALEHILRNAVGHGLEDPETRAKLGKPDTGTVHIGFAHEGSEVVLTISDDGAGINIDALRNKAIEKGRMLPDAELSDTEILEFILESGFSTAETVTQISGRGVGMDVVNTEIKQLGGTLHIHSDAGQGTRFTLRLPLTVLVNQALMAQVGEATYAIQLPNIEHVVRVGRDELGPLSSGEQVFYEYAGNQYQYLNLATVLHGSAPLLPEGRMRVPLMLIRTADHRIALQVDNLLGRQEIVIKSVGPQLSTVGVLSGATIMPNGEVALILDVANLIRSALAQQHGKAAPLLPTIEEAQIAEEHVPTVMIVDDSITVRKVTERLLKRYDYNIITAKDGVDALTVMLEQIPDIMLLDVEMPRMDGYELASTMRNDARLKDIPIIMITSRTGEKHRQRALDIGVNMYMGKPYQEHELIDNIRSLTGVEQG